jgi:hypothetical protein
MVKNKKYRYAIRIVDEKDTAEPVGVVLFQLKVWVMESFMVLLCPFQIGAFHCSHKISSTGIWV